MNATKAGPLQVVNGTLVFADTKIAGGSGTQNQDNGGTLTLKKTDFTDRTKGLAGVTFIAKEVTADSSTLLGDGQSDANGDVTFKLGPATTSTRTIVIAEDPSVMPAHYAGTANSYKIFIDAAGNYTVGEYGDTKGSDRSADGVLQVKNNQITFGNKRTAATAGFKVKKTALDDRYIPLVGGSNAGNPSFTLTEETVNADGTVSDTGTGKVMPLGINGMTADFTTASSTAELHVVKLIESAAPTGYVKNPTPYYVTVSADKGVVGVSKKAEVSTADHTPDNVVKIDTDGTVNFGDQKATADAGQTVTVKKSLFGDTAKALAGASFTLTDMGSGNLTNGTVFKPTAAATDNNGLQQFKVTPTPDGQLIRIFRVDETTAPAGYAKAQPYYLSWSEKAGVMTVGKTVAEAQKQTLTSSDQVASLEKGTDNKGIINIADVPQPTLTLTKADATDTSIKLPGAKMVLQEVNTSGGALTGSDNLNAYKATTDQNGQIKVALPGPATPGTKKIYRVMEDTAPNGYKKYGASSFIFYTVGTGVTGVGATFSSKPAATSDPLSVTSASEVQYVDAPNIVKIHVSSRLGGQAADKPKTAPVGNVGVTLTTTSLSTPKTTTWTTDQNGEITLTQPQLLAATGLTAPPSGDVVMKLHVDTSAVGFTPPMDRLIKINYVAGSGKFVVYTDTTDAQKGYDGAVTDHSKDANIPTGDLGISIAHDTFSVETLAKDTAGNSTPIGGAVFTLQYLDGSTDLGTATITILDNGTLLLQDPDTLLNKPNQVPIGKDLRVIITQLKAPEGYSVATGSTEIGYNSARGYSHIPFFPSTNPTFQDIPNVGGLVDSLGDADAFSWQWLSDDGSVQTDFFSFGGSQITYRLKEHGLTLDSVPDNLNFGQATVSDTQQKLPVLPDTAASDQLAQWPTDQLPQGESNTVTTEDDADTTGHKVCAQVTQKGTYADGWHLDLTMGNLVSADQSDTISDASLSMQNAANTKDGAAQSGLTPNNLQLTMGVAARIMDTTTNSAAGVYKVNWNVNDVNLLIPANEGKPHMDYHAKMTWNLVEGP